MLSLEDAARQDQNIEVPHNFLSWSCLCFGQSSQSQSDHLDCGHMEVAGVGVAGQPEDHLQSHQVSRYRVAHVCTTSHPLRLPPQKDPFNCSS